VTFCLLLDIAVMSVLFPYQIVWHETAAWTSDRSPPTGSNRRDVKRLGRNRRNLRNKDDPENGRNQVNRKERLWQV
jgi:hypothetical protein